MLPRQASPLDTTEPASPLLALKFSSKGGRSVISMRLCAPEELKQFVVTKSAASHYWAAAWEALDEGLLSRAGIEERDAAALERVACLALLRAMHHQWANVPSFKLNLGSLAVHDGCAPAVLEALQKAHAQAKSASGGLGALDALREGVIKRLVEGAPDVALRLRATTPYITHAAANPRVQAAIDAVYRAVRAAVNGSWPACGAVLERMWPELCEAVQREGR